MAEVIYLKRNTTPIIPIRIEGVDYTKLTRVVFGFKACKHKDTPLLFKKTILYTSSSVDFTDKTPSGVTVNLSLTAEETFKLKPGDLFVDVYPIQGATVINTGKPLRYEVIDTLLDEVIT